VVLNIALGVALGIVLAVVLLAFWPFFLLIAVVALLLGVVGWFLLMPVISSYMPT
jgi:hypothetical protein